LAGNFIVSWFAFAKTIFIHGFITINGRKISKSQGNIIDPFKIVQEFGTDPLRYFLLKESSPFDDLDYTLEKFQARYNGDLANGLGNLTSRVIKLISLYKDEIYLKTNDFEENINQSYNQYHSLMKDYKFNEALDLINYLIKYLLENCYDDLEFLNNMYDKELLDRLNHVLDTPFERLTYTDAIDILKNSNQNFEFPVYWGVDLQSEHERYLVEKYFNKPVILTDYPKEIKAFYMKLNDDDKTVKAMDVLVPRVGEIIGGSQREDNYNKLFKRIQENHVPMKDVWWYLETRKFGSAPHSGFGLGFERFMLFVTGMANIRDVIPFPRTPKNIEF